MNPKLLNDIIRAIERSEILGDIPEIQKQVRAREITRLVHFTRIQSLEGIIGDRRIESTRRLLESGRMTGRMIERNDDKRLDGYLDFVCCSVEYPNVYLLHEYRQRNPDQQWVHLCLKPNILALKTTKFAPVNAASELGTQVNGGIDGFSAMFEKHLPGRSYVRKKTHLSNCPTDLQAEVLVKDSVPLSAIDEVIVESAADAATIDLLIQDWPDRNPSVEVQPLLFDKDELPKIIRDMKN